jgi:hypothetical protein
MWAEVGFVTFGRQVLATLMVLCGMTVLDIGSRAHAAFWTNVVAPQSGSSAAGASNNDHESQPSWPISEESQHRLTKYIVAYTNFGSGGASAPPTTSSTSGPSSVPAMGALNLLPDFDRISNERVRMLVHRTGLSSLLVSIFEPPRVCGLT